MNIIKQQFSIGGMTCINCQNKIEHKLRSTHGIAEATVSYTDGTAEITYDSEIISPASIVAIIEQLGYTVPAKDDHAASVVSRTVCLLSIIVSLYVLLQRSGILNLLVPSRLADSQMGYGMLFVIGLITSVHCIAMCGGINLSQSLPQGSSDSKNEHLLLSHPAFLYNLGRVISYTGIGFILGAAGMVIGGSQEFGLSLVLQGILKIIAGVFMVIMGINMLQLFPWLRKFTLRPPKSLAARITIRKAKEKRPLIIGILNGLMPCGPLQSMQIVALASGNPFSGALSMFMFSLGTVPLMLGFGSIVSALGKKFTGKIMTIGAILVVVLGLAMISQGGSLSGFLLPGRLMVLIVVLSVLGVIASLPARKAIFRSLGAVAAAALIITGGTFGKQVVPTDSLAADSLDADDGNVIDGVQVITSTLSLGKYPNITVQAGIPVKWIIDAPKGSINGCNYKMIIQEYNVTHVFNEGENIIEFTPEKTGTIQYSCWMGMIHGNIFVTDGSSTDTEAVSALTADVPVPAGYEIPVDQLAVAQSGVDEYGNNVQTVAVTLTDDGFSPAVIVAEPGLPLLWTIDNQLSDASNGTELLAPLYSIKLDLLSGENTLYLYPQDSFEVSTGDHQFYAYLKIVEDIDEIDEASIRQEVKEFETLIYPDTIFESQGMSCCG